MRIQLGENNDKGRGCFAQSAVTKPPAITETINEIENHYFRNKNLPGTHVISPIPSCYAIASGTALEPISICRACAHEKSWIFCRRLLILLVIINFVSDY